MKREKGIIENCAVGFQLYKKGQYVEAISAFQKAIEQDSGLELAYLGLGLCFMKQSFPKRSNSIHMAEKAFLKVYHLLIDNLLAEGIRLLYRGICDSETDEAEEIFRIVLLLDPERKDVKHYLKNIAIEGSDEPGGKT